MHFTMLPLHRITVATSGVCVCILGDRLWGDAVEIATKMRDVERLQAVHTACSAPAIRASVATALASLASS